MRSFESGVAYLRQEARSAGLIQDSDNNDVLIEKVSQLIRKWKPAEVVLLEAPKPEPEPELVVRKKKVSKKAA